jgi:hypothetical protein
MKNIIHHVAHHVVRHAKTLGKHVHKHHKRYLLWVFGGFAVVKMLLLFVAGVEMVHYSFDTFASEDTGCVMTGQLYISGSQSCTTISGYLTWGTQVCVVTQEWYYTGGALNESGDLVGQTYVDPVESCSLTGQTMTEDTQDCTTIEGYWTGGTLFCPTTGDLLQSQNEVLSGDSSCTTADIEWTVPLSGSSIKWRTSLSWSYLTPDCTSTGHVQLLTLQLYDHNKKWISLATVSSLATGYTFDTLFLSWYSNASGLVDSGIYTVTNASGTVLFTGVATWAYTNFATGYQLRLLDSNGAILSMGNIFTIDNVAPALTAAALASTDAVSGIVGLNDQVTLSFTASEVLSGVTVLIWGTWATLTDQNGLTYTYTQTLTSGFTQGVVSYSVLATDLAGNTGLVSGTGGLSFDKTAPVVSALLMTWNSTSWFTLSFVTSEPARFAIIYAQSGASPTSWTGTDYITGHEYLFTWLETTLGYVFRLQAEDIIGNRVMYSGSFVVSDTGVISFVYAIYSGDVTTGTLLVLTNILKDEINKFNVCKSGLSYTGIALNINKNKYVLHMPEFTKTYVKKVVNAFSLLILDKVEKNKQLTKTEVTEITDKFDNFLIILKLIRDDDNVCKQNLSNYHISQFKRALDEYGIYFQ